MIADAVLATTIKTCRFIQPHPMRILGVEMARPKPLHAEIYLNYFKAPVSWDAGHTVIHFDSIYLNAPSIHANQSLLAENDRQATAYFGLRQPRSITDELRAYLHKSSDCRQISLDSAARHLNMGGRSLQRELHAQGSTYCQLLEDVRKQKAQRMLADSTESVTQIALTLGFRDTGNFCRAFKRWFACSPNAWRRQVQGQRPSVETHRGSLR
ncbi:helix-turn-helix transcriptional regulator [Allohahella marinimesophila]|uniref:HTH araC/xylS-type domain-containing protein n=1 Tax=Allohahella marinimesophila TaxID=1054972 RepID=A0ABP7PGH4_9GAMM